MVSLRLDQPGWTQSGRSVNDASGKRSKRLLTECHCISVTHLGKPQIASCTTNALPGGQVGAPFHSDVNFSPFLELSGKPAFAKRTFFYCSSVCISSQIKKGRKLFPVSAAAKQFKRC